MNKLYFMVFFVGMSAVSYAQRGKHGALTVTTPNRIVNEYTSLTSSANAGNTTIYVASNNLNSNFRFSGPLEPGDLLMIIQMQGVSLNAFPAFDPNQSMPFDETWGAILNYNNCGNYEFAEVHSLVGTTQINLVCGLKNNYTHTGKVQVIRVPRYTSLTVNGSASLTCEAWNGQTGGVIVTEVSGNINILSNGSIHANERGFRGGQALLNTGNTGGMQYGHNNPAEGAEKGEGVFGYKTEYNALGGGMYCKGAAGNAGGGGNMHNAGGGGGGNAGIVSNYSGFGNPLITDPNWVLAWNLESPGFANHTSSGGGRGGYTFSSVNLNALAVGPGNTSWGGDARREQGGRGGRPLDYSTGKIFMGGGGGAGHQNDDYGGDGGNGGGIVFLLCYGNVTGNGTISANGQAGFNAIGPTPPTFSSTVTGTDGAGGGGAGGTIIVLCEGTVSGVSITANGGKGGDQIIQKGSFATNNEAEGPGGGGGGGYIAISYGTPFRQASGGTCGTTNSSGLTEFTPNGATAGGAGIHYANIYPTILTVNNTINACAGDNVSISASLSVNVPSGTQIVWWNTQVGGTPIHNGPTLNIPNIQNSQTVWVGFCPGWYRIPVTINVASPVCTASPDTTICYGSSVQLNATGGQTYTWSPAATLSNPNIPNPVASPLTTTTYSVTAYDGLCSAVDYVTVTVSQVNASASNDTVICAGQSVQLWASGGNYYQWSNGNTLSNPAIPNPIATPQTTTTYTVTVTDLHNCHDTETVTIIVNPLPNVYLGNDTTICSGDILTLDAGQGYLSYNWQPSGSTQTIQVSTSGTYSVTVTDNNMCSGSDDITVTVIPHADATINDVSPVCSNAAQFMLTAAQSGGIWSGPGIIQATSGLFQPSSAGAGNHVVTYTIGGMCGDSDTTIITVYPVPTANLTISNESCIDANDGTIGVDITGGTPDYSLQWSNGSNAMQITQLEPGIYTVQVTDANGCTITNSATVLSSTEPCFSYHAFVANIFSPNDDNVNDILYVRGEGILYMEFIIFNRWGQKMFETQNQLQGWNGTYKGQKVEPGVYSYSLKVTFVNNTTKNYFGTITVVY